MKVIKLVAAFIVAGFMLTDTVSIFKTLAYGQGNENYQDNALSQGYQTCFQNSGTAVRLGKLSGKLYEMFLKTLEPGMVRSGEPKTFAWVDGAARFHMCTCIVELESSDSWVLRTTEEGYSESKQDATSAEQDYRGASTSHTTGQAEATTAEGLFPCGPWPAPHGAHKASNASGHASQGTGKGSENKFREGTKNEKSEVAKGMSNPDSNIQYRDDIEHSRTVTVMNFQFHMGSPLKSMWGDVDEMTFYPPVAATATASFNYNGQGNIHRRSGSGSDPKHECGLIAAF